MKIDQPAAQYRFSLFVTQRYRLDDHARSAHDGTGSGSRVPPPEHPRTDSDADARGRLEAAVSSLTPVGIGLHKTVVESQHQPRHMRNERLYGTKLRDLGKDSA